MKRILLVDEHEIVRIGLKKVFAEAYPGGFFGEAATAKDALECTDHGAWDLVILELAVDGHGGLELLKEIKRTHPRLPVLILSSDPERPYAFRAIRAGAAGYLVKGTDVSELLKAVKHVMNGSRYVSPSLAETLSAEFQRKDNKSAHELLSDRELQVMRLIGSGKTVSQIALLLNISDKTVSTYRSRILEKTGFRNNAELVRYVVEYGFGDP